MIGHSKEPLFLTRMVLDRPSLYRFALRGRLPLHPFDEGYLIHCLTKTLFADAAPKPFAILDSRRPAFLPSPEPSFDPKRAVEILGYTDQPLKSEDKKEEVLVVDSKPLPQNFPRDSKLFFSVRICPVARCGQNGARSKRDDLKSHDAEIDVFLKRCFEVDSEEYVSREECYREFLRREFARNDAAEFIQARLVRFRRIRLIRRARKQGSTGRSPILVERPDATMEGTLVVRNPDAFMHLLRRGVGRHRAFGFGMLLLAHG